MESARCKAFLAAAETGSFTKAGEKLFISSSAVAQQIGSLEADIGARLFHRTTHGVSLTPIGRYLSEEGRILVEKGHEIRDHIENMRFEQEHCIVLGTSMWQNCSLFFSLWGKFVSEHEQYQLRTVRIRDEFRLHRQGEHPDLIAQVPSSVRSEAYRLCCHAAVYHGDRSGESLPRAGPAGKRTVRCRDDDHTCEEVRLPSVH